MKTIVYALGMKLFYVLQMHREQMASVLRDLIQLETSMVIVVKMKEQVHLLNVYQSKSYDKYCIQPNYHTVQ